MKNYLLVACVLFVSCSCEILKAYTYDDHHKEIQISKDTYEITIEGRNEVSKTSLKHSFLCRAAEITVDRNAKYFVILKKEMDKDVSVVKSYKDMYNSLPTSKQYHLKGAAGKAMLDREFYTYIGTIRVYEEMPTNAEFYDAKRLAENTLPKKKKSKDYSERNALIRTILSNLL